MHLSPIYMNLVKYGIVYHTQPDSNEVEFVSERFFKTEEKARKWFRKNYKSSDFIQPEVVSVSGFSNTNIYRSKDQVKLNKTKRKLNVR